MFLCIRSDAGMRKVTVSTFAEASKEVRTFIDEKGLGAGCADNGWAFHLATIASDDKRTPLATVSYNGRVWNCKDGSEIKCES
jgi:hypothetical protein